MIAGTRANYFQLVAILTTAFFFLTIFVIMNLIGDKNAKTN